MTKNSRYHSFVTSFPETGESSSSNETEVEHDFYHKGYDDNSSSIKSRESSQYFQTNGSSNSKRYPHMTIEGDNGLETNFYKNGSRYLLVDSVHTKGGKFLKIDLQSLEDKLKRVNTFKNKKYDDLSLDERNCVNQIWQVVDATRDSISYSTIYGLLVKYLGEFKSIKPKSVLAILAGCTKEYKGNPGKSGCSLFCAGSVPRPKGDDSFQFCEYNVIYADFDHSKGKGKKGYTFSHLHKKSSDVAYLYVDQTDAYKLNGFSKEEKAQLLALGIKKVQVYGIANDASHVQLTKLVKIEDLPSREYSKNHSSNGNNNGVILFIVIAIIIVILLFFLFRRNGYYGYGGSSTSNYNTNYWSTNSRTSSVGLY